MARAARHSERLSRVLAEAALVALISLVPAFAFNALRPLGLPLVAAEPYQILVPCPEPGGPVVEVAASDPILTSDRSFLVDARSAAEFAEWHLDGAVNMPYDWLDPLPEETLQTLAEEIAASGATRVVVYGDGGRPDSGEHLGREISGRGIRNVAFVAGGSSLLRGAEGR